MFVLCNKVLTSPCKTGYFIAGGIAGMVSRTATAPLDRLKVYLIAQTGTKKAVVEAAKEGAPIQVVKHIGQPLIDATKELWKAGGVRSLFAGNGLNVVKVMPESAIKFGAYEASKRALARIEGHNDPKHLHPASQFLAGGFGGVVSQCVVYPLDTLKLYVFRPVTPLLPLPFSINITPFPALPVFPNSVPHHLTISPPQ